MTLWFLFVLLILDDAHGRTTCSFGHGSSLVGFTEGDLLLTNDVEGVFESWGWSLQSTQCLGESPKVTGSGRYRFILPRDVHVILLFKSFICGILIYPPLKGSTIATRQTPGWIISEFKQPIVRDHGTFPLTTGWAWYALWQHLTVESAMKFSIVSAKFSPQSFSSSQDSVSCQGGYILADSYLDSFFTNWAAEVL